MAWWIYLLFIYGIISMSIDLGIVTCLYVVEKLLNPLIIYKERRVNIFGCIMLTIGGHLLCPWIAPFYWFYKLCTVGRT